MAIQLGNALEKKGFAYLVNVPLTFGHEEVFGLAKKFSSPPENEKLRLGKKSF